MERYEAFKDSGVEWIGEIPKEWALARTKALFASKKRIVGDRANKYQRLALTMQGVLLRDKDDNEGLQPEQFEGYQILEANELVFKLIDLENIKTSRVGLSPYTGIVSPAYITLARPNSDNRYFYYWFFALYQQNVFNRLGGNGVRSALNKDDLLNLPMPLPGGDEQQAIADHLDAKTAEIDALVADCEREVELLQEYRKAVISEAVTKGLDPDAPMKDSGVEWISEIPATWKPYRMSALFREVAETGYPDLPILTVSINTGISDEELDDDQLERRVNRSADRHVYKRVLKGDLAYNMMRAWQGSIGASRVDGIVSPAYTVLRPRSADVALASYVEYLLRTQSAIVELRRRSYGIADFRLRLYWQYFKDMTIYLPSIEEQREIVRHLDARTHELDELSNELSSMAEQLRDYRKSLICEAVIGKFKVPVHSA